MSENTPETEAVAIIGMVGRFPGADNLETFWQNIASGVCSLTRFTPQELAETPSGEGYVPVRGVLEGAEWFDAEHFGMRPREAEATDPQQRVFLEACWSALEDAGYDPSRYPGSIGVWGGMSNNTYAALVKQSPSLEAAAGPTTVMLGNEKDYVTMRVAYKLGLRGPAVAQNTACSTSLVAVVNAATALLSYQCDLALAGGVAISFPQQRGYTYVPDSILSPDGVVWSFDAAAAGTVFGSGVGVVVLKRLSEALADGDTIHAVVRGAALNNDGADRAGFTAPSIGGQAEVVYLAQAQAGVSAADITYIETHGTGTQLGDPIEVEGLTRAFREHTDAMQFCALGTLKPNIGHLDVASGIAGLIKATLALKHKKLPPAIHFQTPNQKIDWENSPFFVNTALTDWTTNGTAPRRAGVSSFGFGGTNAHVILEEGPHPGSADPPPQAGEGVSDAIGRGIALLISARTETALAKIASNLADHLEVNPQISLEDVAWTLQEGRKLLAYRQAIVASSLTDAIAKLRDKKSQNTKLARDPAPSVVFCFPGQGAQAVNMGRTLYETDTIFREAVDTCCDGFFDTLGFDLRDVLYPQPGDELAAEARLAETLVTQPALFTISYATAQWLLAQGVTPDAMVGHSLGEYVAATLAEVLTLGDALTLVAGRARLMQSLPRETGGMLAVFLPEAALLSRLEAHKLDLAAVNGPSLCVVSGALNALTALEAELDAEGVTTKRLPVSHAFHSALTDPILGEFAALVGSLALSPPKHPYVSTRTGRWITDTEATDPDFWVRHLRETVRFDEALTTLLSSSGSIYIEVGPGRTLTGLAARRAEKPITIATLAEADARSVVGALWTHGVAVSPNPPARRIPLPTYPFERKRYFADLPVIATNQQETPQPMDRTPRLLDEIQAILADLSGMSEADIAPEATFSELGFDSLFLTQAATTLSQKFKVKVSFRQLMEELATAGALAGHFDTVLPAEPASAPTATAPTVAVAPPPAAPNVTSVVPVVPTDGVQGLIAQQLQLMQQQLALLGGGGVAPAIPPDARVAHSAPLSEAKERTGEITAAGASLFRDGKRDERPEAASREIAATAAHGPFRPIQKTTDTSLTPQQQAHLDQLITEYVAKTRASKDYTAEHRAHLSDPRAVAGFKPFWKELVYPIVAARSKGSKLWDIDGNEFVDLTMGFGLNLLGHSPGIVVEAVKRQADIGIEVGPQSPLAGPVAKKLCDYTGHERAVFCNTGSEAVIAAVRAARTVTGKDKVVTFSGAYHGIHDEVLVRSNGRGKSFPIAPGIPASAVSETIVLEYGTDEALQIIRDRADEIAAVLIEPVQSRHPSLRPRAFLHELRALATENEIAFIFDEIVNGFRLSPRGAAGFYEIEPDMCTYGKVLGGGVPIGALAGKAKFLDCFDGGAWSYGDDSFPAVGMTFFAGTFVRHPLALAAADAVLSFLSEQGPALQENLAARGEAFSERVAAILEKWNVPVELERFKSMFYLNTHGWTWGGLLHFHLRLRNIHIWENRPIFLSVTHTDDDLQKILDAFEASCAALAEGGFITPQTATTYPTTPEQREVWLASQHSDTASVSYNESIAIHLEGPLDTQKLTQGLQQIVRRHDALRTTFSPDGEHFAVAPNGSVEIVTEDADEPALAVLQAEDARRPFDLAHGPLLRARLVRVGVEKHVLLLTAHHIICDGWSFGVILKELAALYSSQPLPEPLPFAEFAARPTTDNDLEFWKAQLTPAPAPLELPTDRPRPPVFAFEGDRQHHVLPAELVASLRKLSGKRGATLFATLLTAYEVFLQKLTGQTELVIGVPAAGQTTLEDDDRPLVGHAVNLLPLRLSARATTFAELLAVRKKTVLDAFDHRACTFGTLVSALGLPRDASRNPLVATTFNLERTGAGDLGFAGLSSRMTKAGRVAFQFELGFNLVDDGTTIEVEASHNTGLFDATTVARWLGHFETLLREIVATDGEAELGRLSLLTPQERAALTAWGDGGQVGMARPELVALFAEQVRAHREKVAVRSHTENLTYAELDEKSDALAATLRSHGATSGDAIAICLPRSVETIISVLAVLKVGAAYVPIDPAYPAERREFLLQDSGARLVISTDGIAQVSSGICGDPGVAALLYTSGTTGTPKAVEITHAGIARLVKDNHYCNLNSNEILLFHSAFAFDATLFEIFGALLNGGTCVVAPNGLLSLSELTETIKNYGITTLWLTAGLFHALVDDGLNGLASVRQLLAGGDALSVPHVSKALAALPQTTLINGYGPTESTTFTACHTITSADTERASIPLGKPIAGTSVKVLDSQQQAVPIGVWGELWIGGDGLARGYRNQPKLTAQKFALIDGIRHYRTGDRVRWCADGVLEFGGRFDSQVKIRGHRIEPGEVEAVFQKLPEVRAAAVVVTADSAGDKALVAFYVGSINESALREQLRATLPAYLVPAQLVKRDSLPLNASGKVDRNALRNIEPSVLVDVASNTEPMSVAAQCFAEVLGVTAVGPDDDFFALGGDSLKAVRLFARLEAVTGVRLPLSALFQSPTPCGLMARIEARTPPVAPHFATATNTPKTPAPRGTLQAIRESGSEPPLILVHHVQGITVLYHDLVKHLGENQPVWAIEAAGLDGTTEPHASMASMASDYAALIQAQFPTGPYRLGGFSSGGIVALEVARVLREHGAEIAFVGLIDSYAPDYHRQFDEEVNPETARQRLTAHWNVFRKLDKRDQAEYLKLRVQKVQGRLKKNGAPSVEETAPDESFWETLTRVREAQEAMIRTHFPESYDGQVTLFRASERPALGPWDTALFWGDVLPNLAICEVPGDHHLLIQEPLVKTLAAELERCLSPRSSA